MTIKPIKTAADHQAALERIEQLFDAEPDTAEGDELEVLVTLVSAYEEEHFPIDAPDPIAAIQFRMEQQGLSKGDMIQYLGSKSRVSEVLNRKRRLTLDMIRSLSSGLRIPIDSLVQDYKLAD